MPLRTSGWATARSWLLQAAVLAAIGMVLLAIAHTTLENLERLGVESGFDFLGKRAGFDINQTLFEYSSDAPVYRAFLVALSNTLLLAVLSIAVATLVGILIAICRLSRDWFLKALGYGYIELFRNIPALLQIFFWYFVVLRALPSFSGSWHIGPSVILNNRGLFLPGVEWRIGTPAWAALAALAVMAGAWVAYSLRGRKARMKPRRGSPARRAVALAWLIAAMAWFAWVTQWIPPREHRFGYASDWVMTPELGALILGLALYNASAVAEVVRAGLLAVPRAQWEAARSLGLSRWLVLRCVIAPQAMRVIVPPLTTCYINIFKATSLGAAIGYPEVVSVLVGTTNNLVGRPVEIIFLTFMVYSFVSLIGIGLMSQLNRRYNRFTLL